MVSELFDLADVGVFLLRAAIAAIFLWHGPKKLNGTMGQFITFIGAAETLGGLAVLAGFLTQFAALGLAVIMLGAIHKKINVWHVPFSAMDKTGWELDLMILATCLALMTLGPGLYSVDIWLL